MHTSAAVLYEMGKPAPYAESRPLDVVDVDLAEPGIGEVTVELAYAGLCHSDLSVVNGSRPRVMPMVLGHEASGIVRELGPGVDQLSEGDHVVFSYVPTCGRCLQCLSGRAQLCENGARANLAGTLLRGDRRFTGKDGQVLNHHLGVSAFSNFTVAAQESLVKIDPDLPLDIAALFGCAVLTGVGAVANTAAVPLGSSVAAFGLGGVGLSVVLGAAAVGAHPIIAVDVVQSKLELAQRLGATHVVDAGSQDPVEAIRTVTGGGADYTFESVGSERVLIQAYEATGLGGTTVTVGLPDPSRQFTVPAVSLVVQERTVKGSYMGSAVPRRDVPRFIAMYQAGRLPVDLMLSGTLPLAEVNAGLDALDSGQAVRQLVGLRAA